MRLKARRWLILALACAAMGTWFRFSHITREVFWDDEAVTALRVSGHEMRELHAIAASEPVLRLSDLVAFQNLDPGASVADTVRSLLREDPQHPPLYYATARAFLRLWPGDTASGLRALSACFGVLFLGAAYLLALELFGGNQEAAALTLALASLSPMDLIFAREAREYMLWLLLCALSSAAFLRAIRGTGATRSVARSRWVAYAGWSTLSLWTSPLSAVVLCAHGATTLVRRRGTRAWAICSAVSIAAFAPWVIAAIPHLGTVRYTMGWLTKPMGAVLYLDVAATSFSRVFFDLNLTRAASAAAHLVELPAILFVVAVTVAAFVRPWRRGPSLERAFLFALALSLPVCGLLFDLCFHARSLAVTRYFLPCTLAAQLAVAGLLASLETRKRILLTAPLLALGAFSLMAHASSRTWWNKTPANSDFAVAALLSQQKEPVLLTPYVGSLLALSRVVDSNVYFEAAPPVDPVLIEHSGKGRLELFAYRPSQDELKEYAKDFELGTPLVQGELVPLRPISRR